MKTKSRNRIVKVYQPKPLFKQLPAVKPSAQRVSASACAAMLEEILNHQIANRGTDAEFFRCFTYGAGKMPEWVKKAEQMAATLHSQNL